MDFTKEEMEQQFNDIQIGKRKRFKSGSFVTENNRKLLLQIFVERLLNDNVINNIDELPSVICMNLFNKYKLINLIKEYFSSSPVKTIRFLFPDKWEDWQFNCNHVSPKTWNNKQNVINAVRDMVFNKINIKNYTEIFKISSKQFKKYRFGAILNEYHYNIPKLMQECFPEYDLLTWRFYKIPQGYWDKKEHRILALKDFIENVAQISIEDIPLNITSGFLHDNTPKLHYVSIKYYKGNLFNWINEIYPNIFRYEDFTENIGKDGTRLDSRDEVKIHNLFLDCFNKVEHFENMNDKKNQLHNKNSNEYYVPDWILDENIIVEYFGLYAPHRNTKFSKKYLLRTYKKIEFYNSYCEQNEFIFVDLYPDDMKNNLQGIKDKLNIH